MRLMSKEWAEAYMKAWNSDEIITKKLKRFSSVFQYSISDRKDITPLIMKIEKGLCVGYETTENFNKKEIEYQISSDSKNWQKIFDKNVTLEEVMDIEGFEFKGPKLKALSNMSGLKRGVELMSQMDGVTL